MQHVIVDDEIKFAIGKAFQRQTISDRKIDWQLRLRRIALGEFNCRF